ncbi:MAG: hypothetical protein NTW61_04540 [Candidatus Melainabacteria bacterium]|nr:hypothetical protein [Candidatus Melainabacteria bacterium]
MATHFFTSHLLRLTVVVGLLGSFALIGVVPLPTAVAAKASNSVSVKEVGDNAVQATLLVERPVAQVYDVIRQTEKILAKDPTFESVVVTKRMGAHSELVKYRQKVSPFLPVYVYTSQVDYTLNKGSRFHRVSGSFKSMDGSCQLVATDNPNQTKIVYTLKVALDVPLPQAIINHLLKHDLPRSLNLMKAAVYQQYPSPIKVATEKK